MSVRAKFKCDYVTDHGNVKVYKFSAICADEIPENQRYHKYTPTGSLEITVNNPDVAFEPQKAYYLDFTPADEPATVPQ